MSKLSPFKFQRKAIEQMLEKFVMLWKRDENKLPLVLKAPTGSGKTFISTSFINNLNNLPNWNEDKAFIWITFSDDLAMQSKDKFREYYSNSLSNILLTVNDIDKGKLDKNDILFINWQKIVSRSAENRILRRPENIEERKESGKYFEDFIDNTHVDNREIILIIDEAHKNASTNLSQDIIDYINPKIILYITATPNEELELHARRNESFIDVCRKSVVKEGLIKEKIVVQTEEDLERYKDRDLDEALLDMAIEKRKDLLEQYKELGKDINPLILIQLPNDDNKLLDLGQKTKEQVVLDYLLNKGVDENKIALWFDGKQKNMEFITENDSDIEFMLFKQAAGTGWDCPRSHILVMYREINSTTFFVQTIGRILRMAEPKQKEDYINHPDLRTGFLYTNYKRNEIKIPDQSSDNMPNYYIAKKQKKYSNIEIESAYISRIDYGDLSNSAKFQSSFIKSMNKYFNITIDDVMGKAVEKLEKKKVDLNPNVTNQLIVDAEFEDFDQLSFDFIKKGNDLKFEMSQNDVEKTFNYYCYKILQEQTEDEAKISNISRSWSPLKSAIRVWLRQVISEDNDLNYRIFINDINKNESSVFRPAITKAIKDYKPILEDLIKERKTKNEEKNTPLFKIRDSYSFSDKYEKINTELCVLDKYYILKENYRGKENEQNFMKYIDTKKDSIEWWFKNGDYGKDYFAIIYYNTTSKREALFYPDWIIKFKSGKVGIFDTKSGSTANTEGRAKGLAKRIEELGNNYVGGIVIKENGIWYYNNSVNYEYIPGKLNDDWKLFEDLLYNV